MSTNMQAIKTEYNGTVFDSKSEAVFARTLHLLGHSYVYHPPIKYGHEWDFLVFRKPTHSKGTYLFSHDNGIEDIEGVPCVDCQPPILVEYKPSEPTNQYFNNLQRKQIDNNEYDESVIVYGSPWSETKQKQSLSYECKILHTTHQWRYGVVDSSENQFCKMFQCYDDAIIEQAKQYRFDLRH